MIPPAAPAAWIRRACTST